MTEATDLTRVDQAHGGVWRAFWERGTWWKAVLAIVGYLLIYQGASFALIPLVRPFIEGDDIFASPASVFLGLGSPIAIGAMILLAFVVSVRWLRPLFGRQRIAGRWWMWVAVALVVIPIVLRLLGIDYDTYAAGVVATSLAVGLLIGFTEEILYRGIVVRILRSAGHREWMVAVVSSLLFGLSHLVNLITGQPILAVGLTVAFAFGFGMMMYLVMRVTRSLAWPVLLHSLTDPTTFLATGGVDVDMGAAHSPLVDLAGPFSIIFIIAALLAMILIRGRAATSGAEADRFPTR